MFYKITIAVLLLAVAVPFIIRFVKHRPLYPLMPYKYIFRRRRITFAKTLRLLAQRNVKMIVETGTSRKELKGTASDGAATIVFGKWAKENGAKIHSVDISEASVKGAREQVGSIGLSDTVTVHLKDSVAFLKSFQEPIDFLYLDSYDYSKTDIEIQQKSQQHHLEEFKAAESKLHDLSVVLIGDCRLPNGGKGKLAIDYMLKKEWKILMEKYQVLLVKNK